MQVDYLDQCQKVEILAQNPNDYANLAAVFARITVRTPHSVDVERFAAQDSSLSNETVSHYL